MKVTTFGKVGVTIGAAALLVGALAVPAQADPATGTFGQLVGVGSDTIQDVMNKMAQDIPGNTVASYDAFSSDAAATVVTRQGQTGVPRASGSGAGVNELLVSIGQVSSANVATQGGTITTSLNDVYGKVDFARSSSGASSVDANGVVTYIPFAQDAVTVAVDPASPLAVVPFILGNQDTVGASIPALYNIYRGQVKYAYVAGSAGSYSYVGVGADATIPAGAPAGTSAYKIDPLVPQAGSGTRSYFLGKLGITTLDTTVVKDVDANGNPVQEHNGLALSKDHNAIAPFSISQWVAQSRGIITDKRNGAIVLGLGTTTQASIVAPTTVSNGVYSTNPQFKAMVRDVYNVVPSRYADDDTTTIAKTFVGTDSEVCKRTDIITSYGFALMPGTSSQETCGSTDMRAFTAAGGASVTLSIPTTSIAVGSSTTATATIAGDQGKGGTVYLVDGDDNTVDTKTVAAGSTTATFTVDGTAPGSESLHAEFVPALAGVKISDPSAATTVTTVAAPVDVLVSTASTGTIGKAKSVIVWVDGIDAAGGTITLKDGATTLGTVKVAAGESAAAFSFTPKKLSYSLVASYTSPSANTASGSSAVKAVMIAKGTATISFATPHATHSTHAKLVITVAGTPTPTGSVNVKEGTKTLVGNHSISGGKITLTLPLLAKGTHRITVTYNGNTYWVSSTKAGVVGITS